MLLCAACSRRVELVGRSGIVHFEALGQEIIMPLSDLKSEVFWQSWNFSGKKLNKWIEGASMILLQYSIML